MKRLPRIGLLLSSAAQGAEWTSALRRALPAQAWGAALAPTPPGSLPEASFAELERSSEALLAVPCASVADARAALARGELAALVHVGAPDRSCLWQRGSVRGVEPGARGTAAQVEAAGLARDLLRRLGRAQPRFGVLASDPPGDAELSRRLRDAGVDCAGALEPYAAAEVRVDAWLSASSTALHTVLAFAGSGARFALGLGGDLELWVGEPGALGGALDALAPLLPAPRDAPRVQVQARQAPIEDRCPYCHRPTESDATDGLAGPPVTCASCSAPHHRDCLAEHGGCAVMGCSSTLGLRWGVELPLATLSAEQAQRVAFEVRPGVGGDGPLWVRVEAPIDDPRVKPGGRRVRLVLPKRAERGSWIHGFVAVECPRDFPVRGGVLELETTLSTRSEHRREQRPIVSQRAAIFGSGAASALGRLGDGVASIFGSAARIVIPPGVRRYPIALRIPAAHPPTVSNRFKDVEESVQTLFRVQVGAEHAEQSVEVY